MKLPLRALESFRNSIASVHVQGATAVAHETLRAFEVMLERAAPPLRPQDWQKLAAVGADLAHVRPTEPLARNLVRWCLAELRREWKGQGHSAWENTVAGAVQEVRYALREAEARLVAAGAKLVRSRQTIFTHCHSSLAERVLGAAHRQGRKFSVYHTETAPLFQGRITDERLREQGIPTVMVVDSAAPFVVSKHSGDDVDVDWVLLGADSVGRDGSVLNKIGSFGITLAAHDSNIPVYVTTPLLKVDWQGESTFERRSEAEVWPGAPVGTHIVNYAFDMIPAKFITGIVCEFGVVRPSAVARLVRRHYPWLTRSRVA